MITRSILFLCILQFCFTVSSKEITSITGFVDSVDLKAKKVKIRTGKEDIVLDFDKLDKETKEIVSKNSKKVKLDIKLDEAAVIKRISPPMGIRADCSEIPTDMNELEDIAKNSSDMLDFLNKIPEGSLQGFTFVTNSLSLHRGRKDENGEGQVSPMWPRVLRSSIDGKTTISFVCDPKNPTFGKVEIIHFDSREKEFKTTEFNFGHPKEEKVKPEDRIHHDPISCISCHAGGVFNGKTSLKPNWPEYFQWSDCKENRGTTFYGGNDDNMGGKSFRVPVIKKDGCTNAEYSKSTNLEKSNYLKFRELQKNNECFKSLPWPDESKAQKSFQSKWSYKYYPYAEAATETFKMKNSILDSIFDKDDNNDPERKEIFNYSLRTNLRITDTYSHLMSQRVANLLKKSQDYDAIKYLLAMEQAGCNIKINDEMKKLNSVMPNFKYESNAKVTSRFGAEAPLLNQFARYAGLTPKDWTMNFQEENDDGYQAGIPTDNSQNLDLKIFQVVGGEILKDIGQSNQIIAKSTDGKAITRGVEQNFGSNFSCIDDLGGAINKRYVGNLCKELAEENIKNLKKIKESQPTQINCIKPNVTEEHNTLNVNIENVVKDITQEQISRGKKLVELDSKGKCVMCHSSGVDMLPKDFRFIPSEADKNKAESVAILKARKDEIAAKIENRLIKTKTMPPMANELTDQDREDVQAYLLSVANGK